MSYILYTFIHVDLVLGRVVLTCDCFALAGYTSTPKGGYLLVLEFGFSPGFGVVS